MPAPSLSTWRVNRLPRRLIGRAAIKPSNRLLMGSDRRPRIGCGALLMGSRSVTQRRSASFPESWSPPHVVARFATGDTWIVESVDPQPSASTYSTSSPTWLAPATLFLANVRRGAFGEESSTARDRRSSRANATIRSKAPHQVAESPRGKGLVDATSSCAWSSGLSASRSSLFGTKYFPR